ncbi:hypothetical protein [Elizabethkingia occulta]|uniref:hypothetical protein n=1 Tax=Elizabethkingia occulta TaxID=1867263 RepID=UPI00099AA3E5|nr:hypothetical protein [Elizabethkingia occulta]OPB87813.1 hypothetical protein BB020_04325 [Elizabethkingia occulta]
MANKAQKQYAAGYLKENPNVPALHLNPKGDWFTDINWANYSLEKDKEGKTIGKIETFKQGQKIDAGNDDPTT